MENINQNKQQNFKNRKKRKRYHPIKNKSIDYKPNCSDEIFNIKIEDLDFTDKTYQALKLGGIVCLGQLAQRTMKDMYKIQKIGKHNCFEIRDKLRSFNLDFRQIEEKQEEVKSNIKVNENKNFKNKNEKKENFNEEIKLKKINDHMQKPNHKKFVYEAPPFTKITKSQKCGLLTLQRKEIIPPMYNDIFFFSEGLASFATIIDNEEKYGYINKNNEVIINPIYDIALSFSEGYASVTLGEKSGYIDKEGNKKTNLDFDIATSFESGSARVKKDGKWGIIDKNFDIRWI